MGTNFAHATTLLLPSVRHQCPPLLGVRLFDDVIVLVRVLDYEALLLLQTLMLSAQAMGLGAWIHATISPPVMLGHPLFRDKYGPGLGFEYAKPELRLLDQFRWGTFLPKARIHPVGLPGSFSGLCPPYVADMGDAVDEIIRQKFGSNGIYRSPETFA